jgi:hypothetical protein
MDRNIKFQKKPIDLSFHILYNIIILFYRKN